MPDGGLDSHLHGNANDGENGNATVAQCDIQGSADESRHRYFVEDGFTRKRRQFGHKLELRRASRKTGLYFDDIRYPLPCHPCAQLRNARNFIGWSLMTSEENTHAGLAG